jgi:hypothetical protein
MEVHMLIALIFLIVFGLVVLAGIILSLAAGLRTVPRQGFRLPFQPAPDNDFFPLVLMLTQVDPLWHPGLGNLPDPTGDGQPGEITIPTTPNIPFS